MLLTNIQTTEDIEIDSPNNVYYAAVDKCTLIMATLSDEFVLKRLNRKSDINLGQFTDTFITNGGLSDIVTFSHDNDKLAIATNSKICLVDAKTGETGISWTYSENPADEESMEEFDFQEPIIEIGNVSNQHLIFVAMPNFDIKVWNFEGQLQGRFESNNQSPVTSLSIERDLLISGFMNGDIEIQNLKKPKEKCISIAVAQNATNSNHWVKNAFLSRFFIISLDNRSVLTKFSFQKEKVRRKRKSSASDDWK